MIQGKLRYLILILVASEINYISGQSQPPTLSQPNNLTDEMVQQQPIEQLVEHEHQTTQICDGKTLCPTTNVNNVRKHHIGGKEGRKKQGKFGSRKNLTDFECGIHHKQHKGEVSSRLIAGGFDAGLYSYPSYIRLIINIADGLTYVCGGTLISRQHIITAAHCFKPMPYKSAWAVSTIFAKPPRGTLRLPVKKVCPLPVNNSDVSIIKLARRVKFSATLQPACLPTKSIKDSSHAFAVGLGAINEEKVGTKRISTFPDELQALPVKKIPCLINDRDWSHVCFEAFHKDDLGDTCGGDSGGGIYINQNGRQTLYGITSYGYTPTCRKGQIGYSVYADVYNLRHNITQVMTEC